MRRLLLLSIACAATLAAGQKVVGGPVVVNVTAGTATVVWVVESDQATLRAPAGAAPRVSPSLRVEKTTLAGLQPNTRYEYDVGSADGVKGSFKTPPNGAGPFQFVVFGDTRTRHDVHRRVIEAILKHGVPDFVLHTGDLVANGDDSSLWPVFFDIEKDLLRQAAFFPALGNHERNSRDFYDFFQVATPYYSFNWGNAHFIILNSDVGNVAKSKFVRDAYWAEQTRWLEEDLAGSQKADYRFVVAHHPPISAASNRAPGNDWMAALEPLFEKYRLTAGFFGHDHNYQHFLKNGIHYVITGGGGAPLYDVAKPPEGITVKVASIENFTTIRVDGKVARLEAIAVDGTKLDEIEFKAGAQQ
jgi:3',5'-cyclic AMP phosphodiesterase CpdA